MKKFSMRAPLGVALIALLALTSCESATPTYETDKDGSVTSVVETRVFVPGDRFGCLFLAKPKQEKNVAPVLALLLPALIQTGISTVQKNMNAAAGAESAILNAYANVIGANGHLPECIEIVSGKFRVGNAGDAAPEPGWYKRYDGDKFAGKWANFNAMLKSENVSLTDAPDLVMEFAIVSAPAALLDNSPKPPTPAPKPGDPPKPKTVVAAPLRLVPTFVSFVQPPKEHRSIYRPRPISSMETDLTVQWLGQGSGSQAMILNLDNIQAGKDLLFNYDILQACDHSTAEENGALQCTARMTFVKESPWENIVFSTDKEVGATIVAKVTEARTPSAFVQFFADVLSNSQTDINKDIDAQLPAGQAAAMGTNLNNVSALAGKLTAAAKDLAACAKPVAGSDASQLLATAVSDELGANAAAYAVRQRVLDEPFQALAKDQTGCQRDLALANSYMTDTLPGLAK